MMNALIGAFGGVFSYLLGYFFYGIEVGLLCWIGWLIGIVTCYIIVERTS